MYDTQSNNATRFGMEHGQFITARCEDCNETLDSRRLNAVPNATRCVPCQTLAGDVPKVKRVDSFHGDDVFETYYVNNPYFDNYLSRFAKIGNYTDITWDT